MPDCMVFGIQGFRQKGHDWMLQSMNFACSFYLQYVRDLYCVMIKFIRMCQLPFEPGLM